MANKKLKLLYLARYLREETDERHPRTLQDMIAYLERCSISAERKSLYDDLELLRLYGMDVQSVRGKSYGYFLGDREFQLPELEAAHRRGAGVSLPDPGKSMELIAKLEKAHQPPQRPAAAAAGICNGSGAHPQRAAVLRRGRAAHRHQRRPEGHVPLLRLDGLRRQILPAGGRPVRDESSGAVRGQALLSGAYDPAIQDYRHYRVDRMEELTVSDRPRDPLPADFDLGKYVRRIFDMYNGRTGDGAPAVRPGADQRGNGSLRRGRPHPPRRGAYCRHRAGGGGSHLLRLAVPVRRAGGDRLPDAVRRDFARHCQAALSAYPDA